MTSSSDTASTAGIVQYTRAQEAVAYPDGVAILEIDESADRLRVRVHATGLEHAPCSKARELAYLVYLRLLELGGESSSCTNPLTALLISGVDQAENVVGFNVEARQRHQVIEELLVVLPRTLEQSDAIEGRRVFAVRAQQRLVPVHITKGQGAVLHLPPELKLFMQEWQGGALVDRIAAEAARYVGYHPKVSMCSMPEERTISIEFSILRPGADIMLRLIDHVFRVIELSMLFPDEPAIRPVLRVEEPYIDPRPEA